MWQLKIYYEFEWISFKTRIQKGDTTAINKGPFTYNIIKSGGGQGGTLRMIQTMTGSRVIGEWWQTLYCNNKKVFFCFLCMLNHENWVGIKKRKYTFTTVYFSGFMIKRL